MPQKKSVALGDVSNDKRDERDVTNRDVLLYIEKEIFYLSPLYLEKVTAFTCSTNGSETDA